MDFFHDSRFSSNVGFGGLFRSRKLGPAIIAPFPTMEAARFRFALADVLTEARAWPGTIADARRARAFLFSEPLRRLEEIPLALALPLAESGVPGRAPASGSMCLRPGVAPESTASSAVDFGALLMAAAICQGAG